MVAKESRAEGKGPNALFSASHQVKALRGPASSTPEPTRHAAARRATQPLDEGHHDLLWLSANRHRAILRHAQNSRVPVRAPESRITEEHLVPKKSPTSAKKNAQPTKKAQTAKVKQTKDVVAKKRKAPKRTSARTVSSEPKTQIVPAVSDDTLDQLVADIARIAREGPLMVAYTMGRLIVDRLYRGSIDTWRQERGHDDGTSFRKLCDHPDLPVGVNATGLYRAVAIYQMFTDLGVGVSTWKHLGLSHIRTVLVLAEATEQMQLLEQGDRERWTVEQMEQEVNRRAEKARRGGRPPLPVFEKSLNKLERFAVDPGLLLGGLDGVGKLGPDKVAKFRGTIEKLQLQLGQLLVALTTSLGEESEE